MQAVVVSGCGQTHPPLSGGKPLSYWLLTIKDPDPNLREQAVTKIGNVGPTDAAVLPALLESLKDADPSVRRAAILGLMKFGPGADEAVPFLSEMRHQDRDSQVRAFATKALAKLQE